MDPATRGETMRLPHIRIRTLMIALAVIGLALGGYVEVMRLIRTSREYQRHASEWNFLLIEHQSRMADWDKRAVRYEKKAEALNASGIEADPRELRSLKREANKMRSLVKSRTILVDFASEMKAKYEHAARYPWLSVTPDPPIPAESPEG